GPARDRAAAGAALGTPGAAADGGRVGPHRQRSGQPRNRPPARPDGALAAGQRLRQRLLQPGARRPPAPPDRPRRQPAARAPGGRGHRARPRRAGPGAGAGRGGGHLPAALPAVGRGRAAAAGVHHGDARGGRGAGVTGPVAGGADPAGGPGRGRGRPAADGRLPGGARGVALQHRRRRLRPRRGQHGRPARRGRGVGAAQRQPGVAPLPHPRQRFPGDDRQRRAVRRGQPAGHGEPAAWRRGDNPHPVRRLRRQVRLPLPHPDPRGFRDDGGGRGGAV
ncbi:MAG: Multicopper oxidase, partial [uncultured Thermomicrobiales bacterium]